MAYRAVRMLVHLGYRTPHSGPRDVSSCTMVPPSVRLLFQECGGIVPQPIGDPIEDLEALPFNNDPLIEPVVGVRPT